MKKLETEIIIDDREDVKITNLVHSKELLVYTENLNIAPVFKIQRLAIGDIVCCEKNLVIERKSFSDFIGSIRTKHLQQQLTEMENNFENCYLLISGNIKDCAFIPHLKHYSVAEFVGSIAMLLTKFRTKIFMVNNDTQLLKLVLKIIENIVENKPVSLQFVKKNTASLKDIQSSMLACIPGISFKRAEEILEHFNFNSLSDKEINELIEIPGVGKKIAGNIKLALGSEELCNKAPGGEL